MHLQSPRRCNCLVWALCRFWRKGGYLSMRRGRHFKLLPHFLWSRDLEHWFGYVPHETCRLRDDFGLWFRGHVVEEQPSHSPEYRGHR